MVTLCVCVLLQLLPQLFAALGRCDFVRMLQCSCFAAVFASHVAVLRLLLLPLLLLLLLLLILFMLLLLLLLLSCCCCS